MKRINNLEPKSAEEFFFLSDQYISQDKRPDQIAKQFKVSERLIWFRLAAHGLSKIAPQPTLHYCPCCGQCVGKQLFLQIKRLQKQG